MYEWLLDNQPNGCGPYAFLTLVCYHSFIQLMGDEVLTVPLRCVTLYVDKCPHVIL